MKFGIVIIGDEILSGRRVDKHLPKIIELLRARGLALAWAEYVGDERARIIGTLKRTFASDDICAAAALGVPLELHPQARQLIAERIIETAPHGCVDLDAPDSLRRFNMGVFPRGAGIIPNRYNRIPGFSVRHHYFMPGFPVMAWPMMEWVLDTHYAHLHHDAPHDERSFLVFELPESALTPLMECIERDFAGVRVFSLPSVGDAERGGIYARRHIDLGVKGDPGTIADAYIVLREGVHALGDSNFRIDEGSLPRHGFFVIYAERRDNRSAAGPAAGLLRRARNAVFYIGVGSKTAARIVSPTQERCMRLITKGLLLVAVPSLVEFGLLAGVMRTQAETREAEQWSARSKEVLSQATAVLDPVLIDAVRMRGAEIDGYGRVRTPPSQWGEIDRRIDRLIELVADNPLQVERAVQIRRSAQAYRQWSERSQELLRLGQQAGVVARFREFNGHDIVDHFRAQVAALQQEEMRLDNLRTERVAGARRLQQKLLVAAVIASIVTGGIAVHVFTSSVRRRLSTLASNTKRLADNAPLVPMAEDDDELAEFDLTLHQTSRRLLEADRTESRYRSDLLRQAEELGTMNEHLRERTQENEMFIYSVSHDLRAPLVNLQGFSRELSLACESLREILTRSALTEAQRRRLARIVDQDIVEALRFLQTAVMRSASIIDALLRLSRAGRVEYRPQQVDLQAVAARVVDAMRDSIKSRGVTVKTHPLPSAWGDPTAVEQVFANLVSNAVNYLDPDRPGEIEIGTRPNPVGVHSLRIYYVRDNGYGIPVSALSKLFTAFQRLHGGMVKGEGEGEGIGLALVRRVVERHGGNVWAESTEGIGSTFYLSLPESSAAHEALRAAALDALTRADAESGIGQLGHACAGSGPEPSAGAGSGAVAGARASPTHSALSA
ncbi:hypothetical protein DFQ30_000456 [Apophysomyces sp. BC1015]|nr:hypothetical protein DFQ30_000456 [Apophysomyces sp. BC1015]